MMRSPPSGQPQRDRVEFWRWGGQIELSNCGGQLEVGNARRPVARRRGLSAHVCPELVVIRPFAIGDDAVGEIDQETDGVGGPARRPSRGMAVLRPGQHPGYAVLPEASEKTFLLMPGGGCPENEKGAS